MLREWLLQAGFQDNEYLDQYIELIERNRLTKREQYKTAKHHILPRCYFKFTQKAIDNSTTNLVNLSHKDHLAAHYYLALCAPPPLYHKLVLAFNYMRDKKNHYSAVDFEEWSASQLEQVQILKQEKLRLNGEAFRGSGNPNYGSRTNHWTDESRQKQSQKMRGRRFTKEHCLKISQAEKGKQVSDESRQRMSQSWDYSKHVTSEICHKRSNSMLNKNTKGQIRCIESGQVFTSAAEAARYLNKPHGGNFIRECIKGHHDKAYGLHWEVI